MAGQTLIIQCYCGNTLAGTSAIKPDTDCSMTCAGNATEFCGAGSRLSLYTKNAILPSSAASSSKSKPLTKEKSPPLQLHQSLQLQQLRHSPLWKVLQPKQWPRPLLLLRPQLHLWQLPHLRHLRHPLPPHRHQPFPQLLALTPICTATVTIPRSARYKASTWEQKIWRLSTVLETVPDMHISVLSTRKSVTALIPWRMGAISLRTEGATCFVVAMRMKSVVDRMAWRYIKIRRSLMEGPLAAWVPAAPPPARLQAQLAQALCYDFQHFILVFGNHHELIQQLSLYASSSSSSA